MSASNKEEGPLTRSSAKASAEFLVEFLSENHPPGLLPVKLDVLREALWQEESGGSISCPIQKGGVDLKCEDPEVGCPSSGQCQCSVRKLLVMWQEAGIKTLADAGLNDLEAWQFTESYREHQLDLAGGVLANMKGHLDYLSEENFVFSLVSWRVRSGRKEILSTICLPWKLSILHIFRPRLLREENKRLKFRNLCRLHEGPDQAWQSLLVRSPGLSLID